MKTTHADPKCGPKSVAETVEIENEVGVERGTAGLPTTFVARQGPGRPTIELLADVVARRGYCNRANQPARPPLSLGSRLRSRRPRGGRLAVVTLEYESGSGRLKNTIGSYGRPAKGTLARKSSLAAAGLLDDVDVALPRHPASRMTQIRRTRGRGSCSASNSPVSAAQAASSPWVQCNARDVLESFILGSNLMRGQAQPSARMPRLGTGGGNVPNIVPRSGQVCQMDGGWVGLRR